MMKKKMITLVQKCVLLFCEKKTGMKLVVFPNTYNINLCPIGGEKQTCAAGNNTLADFVDVCFCYGAISETHQQFTPLRIIPETMHSM